MYIPGPSKPPGFEGLPADAGRLITSLPSGLGETGKAWVQGLGF